MKLILIIFSVLLITSCNQDSSSENKIELDASLNITKTGVGFNVYSNTGELILEFTKQNTDSASLETLDLIYETAKEFYAFRRAFIKYLGTEPTEEALKKMLTQDLKASKARLKETFFEKALGLVKGKSFKRLISECKLKTGNEDTLTKITLDEAIKQEQKTNVDIKANRILSFQEFNQ